MHGCVSASSASAASCFLLIRIICTFIAVFSRLPSLIVSTMGSHIFLRVADEGLTIHGGAGRFESYSVSAFAVSRLVNSPPLLHRQAKTRPRPNAFYLQSSSARHATWRILRLRLRQSWGHAAVTLVCPLPYRRGCCAIILPRTASYKHRPHDCVVLGLSFHHPKILESAAGLTVCVRAEVWPFFWPLVLPALRWAGFLTDPASSFTLLPMSSPKSSFSNPD